MLLHVLLDVVIGVLELIVLNVLRLDVVRLGVIVREGRHGSGGKNGGKEDLFHGPTVARGGRVR